VEGVWLFCYTFSSTIVVSKHIVWVITNVFRTKVPKKYKNAKRVRKHGTKKVELEEQLRERE
jgi:hypothetical protein